MQDASAVLRDSLRRTILRSLRIQGLYRHGLQAVYQVVEHFGMHLRADSLHYKLVRGEDLGFYRELDMTGRVP